MLGRFPSTRTLSREIAPAGSGDRRCSVAAACLHRGQRRCDQCFRVSVAAAPPRIARPPRGMRVLVLRSVASGLCDDRSSLDRHHVRVMSDRISSLVSGLRYGVPRGVERAAGALAWSLCSFANPSRRRFNRSIDVLLRCVRGRIRRTSRNDRRNRSMWASSMMSAGRSLMTQSR